MGFKHILPTEEMGGGSVGRASPHDLLTWPN